MNEDDTVFLLCPKGDDTTRFSMTSDESFEALEAYPLIGEVSADVIAMWYANVKSMQVRYKQTYIPDVGPPVVDEFEDTVYDSGSLLTGNAFNTGTRPFPRNATNTLNQILVQVTPIYLRESLTPFPYFNAVPVVHIHSNKFYVFLAPTTDPADEVERRVSTSELFLKTQVDYGSYSYVTEMTATVLTTFYP